MKKLSEVTVYKQKGQVNQAEVAELAKLWQDIIGYKLAHHCKPTHLTNDYKCLNIVVNNNMLTNELAMMRRILIKRVNEACKKNGISLEINDIKTTYKPIDEQRYHSNVNAQKYEQLAQNKPKTKRTPEQYEVQFVTNLANQMQDNEKRELFKKYSMTMITYYKLEL